MLLTRSPLYPRPKASYSFDLHVLGAPPAFILSQDQTLRGKPKPGGLRILVKQKLNQGPYDRFGGRLPRSPVWLRKIPSTVSGSQGSRRGFMPAVRFAFPLGAGMYITDLNS